MNDIKEKLAEIKELGFNKDIPYSRIVFNKCFEVNLDIPDFFNLNDIDDIECLCDLASKIASRALSDWRNGLTELVKEMEE